MNAICGRGVARSAGHASDNPRVKAVRSKLFIYEPEPPKPKIEIFEPGVVVFQTR